MKNQPYKNKMLKVNFENKEVKLPKIPADLKAIMPSIIDRFEKVFIIRKRNKPSEDV